ncbi:peptidoglycan DD-metalloendopeptidase family protein [Virgibacillus halodenitrificans]|uniref:peptidoglycan DD-metalloendopeptidase family protein n=1 Tax=Virgibacillus halodenitrificans TaxID=1482 RepID=UPI000EF4F50F|nr:peptidoglycan DD-metalloendopeptidase family protein [Virgibacillus halodenitrificans]
MARDDKKQYQIDYDETIQDDRTMNESDNTGRMLHSRQQSPSFDSRGRKGGQNSSSSSTNFNSNRKDSNNKDSKNNQQKRKDRDNQVNKRKDKTKNNQNQARDGDQITNPNTLNKLVQEKGKDKLKDEARLRASQVAKQAVHKEVGKKGAKKAIKPGVKLAVKAIKKLAVKGIALASKALLALVGTVGLPAILIGLGVILLIFILMSLSSASLGTGMGSDELGDEAQELREYIVDAAQSTVDSDKPEQQQFKVPEELLAAIVQLESWLEDPEEDQTNLDKQKDLIDEFADELAPEFEYETFKEWTKTRTRVCVREEEVEIQIKEDGKTGEMETETICEEYGWEESKSEEEVSKITKVTAWNGTGTFDYEAKETEWKGDWQTETKTKRYVIKNQNFEYDFAKLDNILNSHDYDLEDKKWFEYFYETATETPMHYIEWLETGNVNFDTGGGFYFDGEIIPGGGIPPQFMPFYRSAEEKYGIPWYVLAAIHDTETSFSTHSSMTSSVGAIGHMQFMPLTWIGWAYPGGTSLGNAAIPDHILTDPAKIGQYGGYGVDANGDGKADPWDAEDAIHTAAKYLKANGFLQNQRQGIRAYNHSDAYVNKVLSKAEHYKNAATYKPNGLPEVTQGDFMVPMKDANVTSGFGPRWGKMHAGMDFVVNGASTAPIVASASGTVVRSYLSSSYGNCVIIRHNINGTQYETLYAHLNSRAVGEGEKVNKGQYIGMMGSTGNSTGPHLHFEIHQPAWASGKPNALNPALFLGL